MKVLLVNGSPHERGCTYTALAEVAKALGEEQIETEIFWVGSRPITGCMGCMACRLKGGCIHEDKVNEAIAKLDGIDGIIVGSPVHYAAGSGQITSFLDRLFYSSGTKLAYKPGAAVVSCRRGGASATFDQLNKYFTINNMPVVSSQYWNQVHGNTPEEVLKDGEGLQIMRTLGRNMAWMLKSLEAGRAAGVKIPASEERIQTNFIR